MELDRMLESVVMQLKAELKLLEEAIQLLEKLSEIRSSEPVSGGAPKLVLRNTIAAAR